METTNQGLTFTHMKPLRIFYWLFGYVLLFALWWMYLLYDKNEMAYREQLELLALKNPKIQQSEQPNSPEFLLSQQHHRRQIVMIFTEGAVFLVLLLLGFWQVRKILLREMSLAEQQRNFILSITHEFKSPLASIRLTAQTLLRKNKDNSLISELLNRALQDTDRLGSLVDNLLIAAKIEQDRYGFREEELNFSEMIESAASKYQDFRAGISVSAQVSPNIFLELDPTAAWSIVGNLLENAIKYTAEGSQVQIKLTEDPHRAIFTVADFGQGIPPEEKEKIFNKFYRVGSEITRTAKGTGLGLFIVKQLVDMYHGKIKVEDNSPSGSIFTVSLPKLNNA